jgi:hypothetical protein
LARGWLKGNRTGIKLINQGLKIMKTKKLNVAARPNKITSSKHISKYVLGSLAAVAAMPLATTSVSADGAPSKVHALVSVEFANEYVTPRGMIVRDQGLTIQPLLLGFFNLYSGDSFINSVTFIPGVWNDLGTHAISVHAPYNSEPRIAWSEIDPIAGIEIGFAKHFTLDITYTAFVEQVLDIGTSEHLDTKLSFDDSSYFKGFGFHPYVEYWQELDGKATDADVPEAVFGPSPSSGKHAAPGSSYYFQVGIDPTYTFKKLYNLKLEAPIDVLLPDDRFYGDYYAKADTVGLFDVGLKGTIPLNFMPQGYGHWSFHAGFKYMYFVDDNLYNLNEFNAPGKATRDTFQVFAGVSVFF